jgi:ATP-dependent protease ClpP protease subunit
MVGSETIRAGSERPLYEGAEQSGGIAMAEAPVPLILSFNGPIEHGATKLLRNWVCSVASGGFSSLTILMNSRGGDLADGFSLYNLLRSLPCEVTTVNMGTVESIAVPVFLAADRRIACPGTRFLLHEFVWNFGDRERLTPPLIEERSVSLAFDRERYRQLLIERCANLTDTRLDELKLFEKPIILDSTAAREAGVVEQVTQYAVPAGCRVLNIDF